MPERVEGGGSVHPGLPKLGDDAFLALDGCGLGLLFRPIIEPGDTGLDLLQQFIVSGDLPVDVAFLGSDAPPLHLTGGRSHVDAGDFINALPFVAAVVDALRPASRFQGTVCVSGPRRPPLLGVLPIIPIGAILPVIFPAAFAVRDAVALAVQVINLAALRFPAPIRFQWANGQQNMSVGIPRPTRLSVVRRSGRRRQLRRICRCCV